MPDLDAPPETIDAPVIPASVTLPEITPKAIVLSIVLAAVLAGANAYLGLFAGMTVSASIPAAVISMAVLRLFRRSNILENNIVQTAASSGEALAAGVIFTIPGLLLIGHWASFDYWQTFTVSLVGGVLGVLFTIPLRRALIIHARLRFPEGVATAEVLKVGASADAEPGGRFRMLLGAAAMGGFFKFAEGGLKLWSESLEGVIQVGRSTFYGGLNLSPALVAVGYIIGLNTAVVVFLGGAIGWLVLLPLYQAIMGSPDSLTGMVAAKTTWGEHIRYIGIGAMLVGGLWTLFQVRGPILQSLHQLIALYGRDQQHSRHPVVLRTERDASAPWLIGLAVVAVVPMVVLYQGLLGYNLWGGVGLTILMVVTAFLFSSVAGYMAGLVGSSSNPVSGVTIATIMLASLLLLGILGQQSVRVQELGGTYGYGLYREAEYVMAALADEIMLNAQWSGRAHWQLLEEELFHSHASGDLFFRKLDRLLSGDTNSSAELAMIFFQALALDFRGRYRGNDPNKSIERYRRRLYHHIYQQAPEDLPQYPFFSQNYQIEVDDEVGRRLPSPHMWWLVLGGIVTVWLVASTLLWQQISGSMQKHIRSAEKYSLSTPGDRP